jgi:hypothetical protein
MSNVLRQSQRCVLPSAHPHLKHTLRQWPWAAQAASNAERPNLHALPARQPAPRRPPGPHRVDTYPILPRRPHPTRTAAGSR